MRFTFWRYRFLKQLIEQIAKVQCAGQRNPQPGTNHRFNRCLSSGIWGCDHRGERKGANTVELTSFGYEINWNDLNRMRVDNRQLCVSDFNRTYRRGA